MRVHPAAITDLSQEPAWALSSRRRQCNGKLSSIAHLSTAHVTVLCDYALGRHSQKERELIRGPAPQQEAKSAPDGPQKSASTPFGDAKATVSFAASWLL